MLNIDVRAGVPGDAAALAELAARTFRETFAAENRAEDMALHLARSYGPSQQQRELADPGVSTLLVDVDGELAGYAQLRAGAAPACVTGEAPIELWRFYVDRPWQGRGVAGALMRRVQSEAYERGGRTLWLGVWERNERAKAFYAKSGFVDAGSHLFMVGTDAQTDRILVRALSRDASEPTRSVLDWLLDSDAAVRWQVMRDLTSTRAEVVAAERSRVAAEGWGARLLDLQRDDGQWGDGIAEPFWWSTMYTLVWLRDLGVDPARARARAAIDLVRDRVTWGPEFGDSPFFEGEVEPCINGRVVALGAYFDVRSDRLVDRLLGEQLADGGWNCQANISPRSSFHTTLCVLEGLLAFEQAFGVAPAVTNARRRAEEYLLERRLLRRLSTGEIIDPLWTRFAFPPLWHYDLLRALDYLRAAGAGRDPRVDEAVALVRERRREDGRWPLDVRHRGTLYDDLAGPVGAPNRWITLRALRVLDHYRAAG